MGPTAHGEWLREGETLSHRPSAICGVGERLALVWTTGGVMRKHGKKFTAARAQVAVDRSYSIEEAIPLAQKVRFAKFDETVELSLKLGVDPKHADQMVRGTV